MENRQFIPSTLISVVKEHVYCEVDGETVILHTQKGVYYGLNEVGGAVWEFIQQPRTVQQIVDMVHGKYDGNLDQIKTDIQELLRGMMGAGLIQVSHSGGE